MTIRRYVTWGETGAEIQLALWREKLEAADGNISHAASKMGFSPRHGFRLTKEHGLNEYAAELRRKKTGRSTGRPKIGGSRKP